MKKSAINILLGLVVLGCVVSAQSPRDCASSLAALEQRLETQRRLLTDWAGLIQYGSENAELPRPAPGENRVVFSVTMSLKTGDAARINFSLASLI